jgi:hypothetical protein
MKTWRIALFWALVALVGAGCASGSGSQGSSPDDAKLEKVSVADGFRLQDYETLYVAETRAEVPNLNPDGKENLEWARGVVRDEVASAVRARVFSPPS